jgi:hypothetical protein
MNPTFIKIPVVILIFNHQDQIVYKAYSPSKYDYPYDISNPNFETDQYNEFVGRVYNHVGYDLQRSLTNSTTYGKLLEIHSRHISVPLSDRGDRCYFTVQTNQHTNYMPVHHGSPVFFDQQEAVSRSPEQTGLEHLSCSHERV